jgi:hypothetical protein
MSHNEFTISEPIEPQEASPMKHEMHVLGIDIAKRVFHAMGMDDRESREMLGEQGDAGGNRESPVEWPTFHRI